MPINPGDVFGQLIIIKETWKYYATRRRKACLCKCSCGNELAVAHHDLLHGKSTSCGCKRINSITKHGATYKGEIKNIAYRPWLSMRQRCSNPNATHYHLYGGKGIKVCDSWDSFSNFLLNMGPRPSLKHSIDRIDNNKGYSPENCRWATKKEQSRNRSNNRLLTYNGQTRTVIEWCEISGLSEDVFRGRLKLKWPVDKIMSTQSFPQHSGRNRDSSGRFKKT